MKKIGFGFKDGKLFLFDGNSVGIIESWPSLKAVRKVGSCRWEKFRPLFPLLRPRGVEPEVDSALLPRESFQMAYQRRAAFRAFRLSIPLVVAESCEEIPGSQLALLKLLQLSSAAVDLAQGNQALAFALAHPEFFRERYSTLEGAAAIARERQREIAGWLGFPETDQAVKTLSKMPGASVFKKTLRSLRSSMEFPEARRVLSHLPRINAGVLGFVENARLLEQVPIPLLQRVAEKREEDVEARSSDLWSQCANMARDLGESLRRPASIEKLEEWYLEISKKWLIKNPPGPKPFPDPPLAGTQTIQAILTAEGLIEEGRLQFHCVAAYANHVRAGRMYVYRVLAPQRATLSIVKGPCGQWVIGQLRLQKNLLCNGATVKHVTNWLENRPFLNLWS